MPSLRGPRERELDRCRRFDFAHSDIDLNRESSQFDIVLPMNMSIVSIQQRRFLFAAATPRILVLVGVLFASTTLLAQSAHYEGAQMVLGSSGVAAYGVAVDSQGIVWVADSYSDGVAEISPADVDLQTSSANGPWGIAVESARQRLHCRVRRQRRHQEDADIHVERHGLYA
jgi:hypothetical protein